MGPNLTRRVSEVDNDEDFRQWCRLEITQPTIICSNLTTETLEHSVFIVDFGQNLHLLLVFPLLTLTMELPSRNEGLTSFVGEPFHKNN